MRYLKIILAVIFLVSCKNNLDLNYEIISRLEIVESDNEIYMNKLIESFALNVVKAKPFYDKAKYISQQTSEISKILKEKSSIDNELLLKTESFFETILSFYWEKETMELGSMRDKITLFNKNYIQGDKLGKETKLFLSYDLSVIRNQIVSTFVLTN